MRQRAVYKKEYEAKADYEFVSVPIESLLSPQINADLDYVHELAGRLPAEPDDAADFRFAFPAGAIAEPIVMGNTVVFTSPAPDILITPVPTLRRTQEGFEIVVEARSRPNFVMAARLNGRLVLQNGVHKVLAQRKRGRIRSFAVVHDVQNIAELGLPQAGMSMFAEANYTSAVRPPLVIDLEGPTAVSVLVRASFNVYRFVGQADQILAPALGI